MPRFITGLVLLSLPVLTLVPGCGHSKPRVVLYCAQDQEFAEKVLGDFTSQSGIAVAPRYDTEADKSVSLYEELVREARRTRCDVHWNNEIVATIRLERKGMLEPYDSPSAEPYPASARAQDHSWHAFAARARVLLVNTKSVKESDRPKSLLDLTGPKWRGKVVMAKPQFGTSATQAACLFEVLGREEAKKFYLGLRNNEVAIVPGNKQAAEKVGQGEFAVGITDTDDAMAEVEAGRPVTVIFPDGSTPSGKDDRMGTLFIPNTLAVMRGCPNPAGAKKLVDFLLSPEVEKLLAESASRQIPLNPGVKANLHPEMEKAKNAKPMQVDFYKAADLWDEVQDFLRKEFARS